MSNSSQLQWPWWHAIGLAATGALFAYWNWIVILGMPVEKPLGYGLEDVWLNLPSQTRTMIWTPVWAPSLALGIVGFFLAGAFLRAREAQTFLTIRLCVYLNILSFPISEMLRELTAVITIYPAVSFTEAALSVVKLFFVGFPLAAANFIFHGFAWIIASILIGGFIAQTSKLIYR